MNDTPIFTDVDRAYAEPPVNKTPEKKVVAATVGGGVGVAIGEIVTWIVEATTQIDIPAGVELAIGVVFTAGLAFVGGYWKRN